MRNVTEALSTLAPSQVDSRSDTDALAIGRILSDHALPIAERMAMVARIARDWDRATAGSSGRYSAERHVGPVPSYGAPSPYHA